MIRVGVTGGIGSGKTTVCRVFEALGVPVYYSDPRAKDIMHGDAEVADAIKRLLGPGAYKGDALENAYVASRVFADKRLLAELNGIVHPAVARDFRRWAAEREKEGAKYVILESAILFESGFDALMDCTVTVSAPEEERIGRASGRDGAETAGVRRRMANQMDDAGREARADFVIHNANADLVLPQAERLHELFSNEKSHKNR